MHTVWKVVNKQPKPLFGYASVSPPIGAALEYFLNEETKVVIPNSLIFCFGTRREAEKYAMALVLSKHSRILRCRTEHEPVPIKARLSLLYTLKNFNIWETTYWKSLDWCRVKSLSYLTYISSVPQGTIGVPSLTPVKSFKIK